MLTITDEGMYELRYNDLIAPMIKAIQELKVQNEKLVSELNDKETRISSIESQLNEIQQVVNELKSKQADIKNVNIGVK
jgi:septal ring factor EnvC (AmiA/AmiB activator)